MILGSWFWHEESPGDVFNDDNAIPGDDATVGGDAILAALEL